MVMDFVPGVALEKLWPTLEQDAQKRYRKAGCTADPRATLNIC